MFSVHESRFSLTKTTATFINQPNIWNAFKDDALPVSGFRLFPALGSRDLYFDLRSRSASFRASVWE